MYFFTQYFYKDYTFNEQHVPWKYISFNQASLDHLTPAEIEHQTVHLSIPI